MKKSKMMFKTIESEIQKIDLKQAATEVLNWLITNVEEFLDNKETIFSLYFPVDKEKMVGMDNVFELGKLYLSIEADCMDERKCLDFLDEKTKKIKQEMDSQKELIEKLFKRLIYYYEVIGFSVKTGPVIQEMDGYVSINQFFFEPIGLDIKVTKRMNRLLPDGTTEPSDVAPEIVKDEHIPEGFVVEIELKKWAKTNVVTSVL